MSDRELLVSGDFASFSFADVMATIGMTRQLVDLVLLDEQGVRAGMLLKAGQILDVRNLRTSATGAVAFSQLVQDPGPRFQVARRRTAPPAIHPIGRLADWLREVQAGRLPSQMAAPPRRARSQPIEIPTTATPPSLVRKTLVEGTLEQFPLPDLFNVLSMSRQRMVLDFGEGQQPRGTLVLKSGFVLSASTADGHSGARALAALAEHAGDRFVVYQEEYSGALPEPVGQLADLLGPPAAPAAPDETLVIDGQLTDFDLADLLDVVALSRHCLRLEIHGEGSPDTVIRVKAGQIVSAEHGPETSPSAVLAALLLRHGGSFVVVRQALPPGASPLGSIHELLTEAKTINDQGVTVVGRSYRSSASVPALPTVGQGVLRSSPSVAALRSSASLPPPRRRATPGPAPARGPEGPPPLQPLPQHGLEPFGTPAGPPPVPVDPRVQAIATELELLRQQITERRLEPELQEILGMIQVLEERVEDRDRTLRSLSIGNDRWITAAVLGVQVLTVAAVVFVGSAWLWQG